MYILMYAKSNPNNNPHPNIPLLWSIQKHDTKTLKSSILVGHVEMCEISALSAYALLHHVHVFRVQLVQVFPNTP